MTFQSINIRTAINIWITKQISKYSSLPLLHSENLHRCLGYLRYLETKEHSDLAANKYIVAQVNLYYDNLLLVLTYIFSFPQRLSLTHTLTPLGTNAPASKTLTHTTHPPQM